MDCNKIIEQAKHLVKNGRFISATDCLVDVLDSAFMQENFESANQLLTQIDPKDFPPTTLTGLCTTSYHARDRVNHLGFLERALQALQETWSWTEPQLSSFKQRVM